MTLSYNPLKVFLPIGAGAARCRAGQARLRLDRQGLPARRQHAADPVGRRCRRSPSACSPTSSCGRPSRRPRCRRHDDRDRRASRPATRTTSTRSTQPDRAAHDARLHGRPRRDARRAGAAADPRDRRRRGPRDARGCASGSPACRWSALDLPDEALGDDWREQAAAVHVRRRHDAAVPRRRVRPRAGHRGARARPGPGRRARRAGPGVLGHVRRLGAVRADLAGRQPRPPAATSASSATPRATSTTGPAGASSRFVGTRFHVQQVAQPAPLDDGPRPAAA